MARIDDDRDQQRIMDRLRQEQAKKDRAAQDRTSADSAFRKLVDGQKTTRATLSEAYGQMAQKGAEEDALSFDSLLSLAKDESQSKEGETKTLAKGRQQGSNIGDKLKSADNRGTEKAFEQRASDDGQTELGQSVASQDIHSSQGQAELHGKDNQSSAEGLSRRGEEMGQEGQAASSGSARSGGALKAEGDGGGGQGSGQQGGQSNAGGGGVPAGFRFNPALMAPVPVAQAKDTGAAERLRKIANEIAQKIVERVRVGTNAAGAAEFQIDLRSNVLSGLSIKVSAGNGKISAAFFGTNKEVLKLLREQSDGLKQALSGRGLTLEELKIEETA